VELPDDRPVTADDIRALRISPVFRGYRMTEVDWLLDQFALVLDERDAEIAALTARLHPAEAPLAKDDGMPVPSEPADGAPAHDDPPGDAAPDDEEQPRA
jgi:DivIVA domain-containing protein